jgi:PAS domain S-box-containing protein
VRYGSDEFARMFAAAPVGMVRFERDGIMSAVNASLARIVGQEIDDLTGKNATSFIHPDDRDRQARILMGLFKGRYDQSYGEVRLLHREGTTVFTKYGAAVMRDEDGTAQHVITVVEDVTERNKLEIELRHAQKLESVWRLAAGIAHEINTPIQYVGDNLTFLETAVADLLGLVETYQHLLVQARRRSLGESDLHILARAEETADLDYLRQNVGRSFAATLEGVRRVATIVQSIKNFAHPDRGEKTPANINSAVKSALAVATNELKYVADVETQLGDLPLLPCYLGDLNQVLLNLLINAGHAIRTVVGDSGRKGLVRVTTALMAGQLTISIRDTGCGIAPDIRDKIFDPFFTTKEVGEGTGQGLALARSVVVDKHGGSITFTSEVGLGTTFVVKLPLPVETPAPAP